MAKQARLGSGVRFKKLANKFAHKGIDNPGGLAAKIGAEKYGQSKMTKMSQAGKKRHAKARHAKDVSEQDSY